MQLIIFPYFLGLSATFFVGKQECFNIFIIFVTGQMITELSQAVSAGV